MLAVGIDVRPSREFAPAGDLLSERPESRQRVAPVPSPLAARGVPCDARSPRPAQNSLRSLRSLRSDSCAESVDEAGFARASGSCASRLLQRGVKEQPNHQQPTAKPDSRLALAVRCGPFSTAEERKALKPCAQRTSSTDSAQLSERSVAKRVLRGASRPEYRRAPLAQRAAVRSGRAFCLLFGGPKSRSPAGANSRHLPRHQSKFRNEHRASVR